MPVRSSVKVKLPPDLLAEVNRRLRAGDFTDYDVLTEWINSELSKTSGAKISHGAFGRYARNYKKHLDAVRESMIQAREIVEADPDNTGVLGDAAVRLLQSQIFKGIVEAEGAAETGDLAKLARAVAQLGRVTVRQREWTAAVQAQLDKEKLSAAEKISALVKEAGLSDKAAAQIRQALLAIDPLRRQPVTHQTALAIRGALLEGTE